ncbi:MAG: hypothetical protein AAGI07_10210 [Bacteroidota bacterium]
MSFLFYYQQVNAQYFRQALRYSQTTFGGTARTQGFSGASVALGGDLSNASLNPAGLGFNRRSEISITPGLGFNNASADYFTYPRNFAENSSDSRINFNIASLGAVFSKSKNGLSSNFGGSFAISVTRINDFNNSVVYRGVNDSTQLVDSFLQQAGGTPWDALDQQGETGIFDSRGLAYFTYLIGPDYDADPQNFNEYTTPIAPPQVFPTLQQETIDTRGAQYEWNFAYGGNYDDRIYYGVGLGIQTIRYIRDREYTESIADPDSPFRELIYQDRLSQTGFGVNLKAGLIYRANDNLRIGLSAVTPTWMRITENFEEEVFTFWNNPTVFDGFNEDGTERFIVLNNFNERALYDEIYFNLRTPARVNAGIAYFFGKKGFITVDLEYLNYGSARLNNPRFSIDGFDAGFDFEGDNDVIEEIYSSNINLRVGGEFRLNDFRFRGGYAYYSDPFAEDDRLGNEVMSFSLGAGIRKRDFYVDLALVNERYTNEVRPYEFFDVFAEVNTNPVASVAQNRLRALFTFGFFY